MTSHQSIKNILGQQNLPNGNGRIPKIRLQEYSIDSNVSSDERSKMNDFEMTPAAINKELAKEWRKASMDSSGEPPGLHNGGETTPNSAVS